MTEAEFASYVRKKTRTNSTTFPDADILLYMKLRQDELARATLKTKAGIFDLPMTDGLVADQREYPYPADVLSRIIRVEAKLDATNFIKLVATERNKVDFALEETNIVNNYSNNEGEAHYFIQRKSIYLLSGTITTVASGLKIWIKTYPAEITTLNGTTDLSIDPSTTTHGMPRELHEIWARGVIIDYKESKEKPIPLNEREKKYEVDKQSAIQSLMHHNLDLEVTGGLPPAEDRGNEGFDY